MHCTMALVHSSLHCNEVSLLSLSLTPPDKLVHTNSLASAVIHLKYICSLRTRFSHSESEITLKLLYGVFLLWCILLFTCLLLVKNINIYQ